jgi:hypothetical protein
MDNSDNLPAAAVETPQGTRGRPFEPGKSGNPNGRPKGHRDKATVICERLLPQRRDRLVTFELPRFETAEDALKAISAIAYACAAGELSPSAAADITGLVLTYIRTLEVTGIQAELAALKERMPQS